MSGGGGWCAAFLNNPPRRSARPVLRSPLLVTLLHHSRALRSLPMRAGCYWGRGGYSTPGAHWVSWRRGSTRRCRGWCGVQWCGQEMLLSPVGHFRGLLCMGSGWHGGSCGAFMLPCCLVLAHTAGTGTSPTHTYVLMQRQMRRVMIARLPGGSMGADYKRGKC